MKHVIGGLIKTIIAIGLLAVAFWPNGLGWYIATHFNERPMTFSVIIALWVAATALNLPLSRTMFTKVSSLSLLAIFIVMVIKLFMAGYFDPKNGQQWIIVMIFLSGILVGWWTNAAKLWKWYRNITAVDDADTGDNDFT